MNGTITIEKQPQRIHTMSSGFDEITAGLVALNRIAAVGKATQDPNTSNIAGLVKDLPAVTREPEAVASARPDLVIASPTQKADVVANIARLGIPVVQLELDPTPAGRINTILLLGYIYGEEERALALAKEVQTRYEAVVKVTSAKPAAQRQVVLSMVKFTAYNAWGTGTTGDGIVVAAGGGSAAAKVGLEGNKQISLETIVAMNPDIIILPMPTEPANALKAELMGQAVLKEVPAIKNGRILLVPPELYTTNSYANVRAVEHLASILWPQDFPNATYPQFSLPVNK
jgi:iron complex transport system substrate-binding protein